MGDTSGVRSVIPVILAILRRGLAGVVARDVLLKVRLPRGHVGVEALPVDIGGVHERRQARTLRPRI
jgi:hypothetical protein